MNRLYLLFLVLIPLNSLCQHVDLVAPLHDSLIETSGLILLNDRLITHNDSGGEPALYEIDSTSGGILNKVIIENASNVDWEDICYDDTFIYIADFGNNAGTRTNLRIFRVAISDYLNTPNDTISADTILFNYADQVDFSSNTFYTNYDAETLIAWNDSLYIFTKNWGNNKTNVYALPKTPGNYSLPIIDSINVEGLITGGNLDTSSNSIILSAHTLTYPFVVEISNFTNSQFSTATIERTQIPLPSGYSFQFESIAPIGDSTYYFTTEQSFSGAAGLFRLDLNYYASHDELSKIECSIYPNPASEVVYIDHPNVKRVELFSSLGERLISTTSSSLDVSSLSRGTYVLIALNGGGEIIGREKLIVGFSGKE
ncbi:MAG: T9SS type A sorting domain-containing protein [Crocinitomicaceae bacterium]|nr:T9SS type A sorting domain-containing protein [Crocinitomicaceae bacterium]